MRVHAVAHAAQLEGLDLTPWAIVVIDAIRASSTIAQATANGCRRIIPVASVEEALKRKAQEGGTDVLLCGERQGLKIDGFDLGNSPREFTAAAVKGKTIVLTTTNGTRAMVASQGAREIAIGAWLNMDSLVRHLVKAQTDVLLVPVGRDEVPVLDDVVCAGMYVDRLVGAGADGLNGEAYLAQMAYGGYRDRLLAAAMDSASGKNLVRIGMKDDLAHLVQVGILDVVPRMVGGVIPGA